jgi:hypothetical protein
MVLTHPTEPPPTSVEATAAPVVKTPELARLAAIRRPPSQPPPPPIRLPERPKPAPRPTPPAKGEKAKMNRLLAQCAVGEIAPVAVGLRPLPANASEGVRKVAADFALVRGLRLRGENDWPVPFGRNWVAERLEMDSQSVGYILSKLVRWGVLLPTEPMAPLGGRKGTACFLPAPGTLEDGYALTDDDVAQIDSDWREHRRNEDRERQLRWEHRKQAAPVRDDRPPSTTPPTSCEVQAPTFSALLSTVTTPHGPTSLAADVGPFSGRADVVPHDGADCRDTGPASFEDAGVGRDGRSSSAAVEGDGLAERAGVTLEFGPVDVEPIAVAVGVQPHPHVVDDPLVVRAPVAVANGNSRAAGDGTEGEAVASSVHALEGTPLDGQGVTTPAHDAPSWNFCHDHTVPGVVSCPACLETGS